MVRLTLYPVSWPTERKCSLAYKLNFCCFLLHTNQFPIATSASKGPLLNTGVFNKFCNSIALKISICIYNFKTGAEVDPGTRCTGDVERI